jgi:hypothetical protein
MNLQSSKNQGKEITFSFLFVESTLILAMTLQYSLNNRLSGPIMLTQCVATFFNNFKSFVSNMSARL